MHCLVSVIEFFKAIRSPSTGNFALVGTNLLPVIVMLEWRNCARILYFDAHY